MISKDILEHTIKDYTDQCRVRHTKPTYRGLGTALNITGRTISNVVKGKYNHKPYGDKPSALRCIDNKDFETVREVFEVTPTSHKGNTKNRRG